VSTTCDDIQAALSARADTEPEQIEPAIVDAHVSHCVACSAFASDIDDLRRRVRVTAAPSVPGLTRTISRAAAAEDRSTSPFVARWLLALVAVQIIVLSTPDLLATDVHRDVAHAARHLGAFTLAYAVGLLVVVARPARARTMLHVAVVLVGALAITGLVDVGQGRAPLIGEATHLPELLSVLLLWILCRPVSASRRSTHRHGPRLVAPATTGGQDLDDSEVPDPLRRRQHSDTAG
jgi:predicted anti-sigma-YlaC factor YlaD